MNSILTIPLAEWMTREPVRAVFAALGEGRARFVGGCVRNTLIGMPATDIDLATTLHPKETIAALEKAGLKAVPTGIDHGTVTAVAGGMPVEITTLRKDVATDGRHAVVAFSTDWGDDARRRDFTMNALYADLQGHIYDPVGTGLYDLQNRVIRFVGDPARRIAEDYLRILRFFRFYAWYGTGEPEEAALRACINAASHIATLSRERVTQETLKLLAAPNAPHSLELMWKNRILPELFHVKYNHSALVQYYTHSGHDPVAGLVLTSACDAEHSKVLETRMVFSGAVKKEYAQLCAALSSLKNTSEKTIKILIYRNNSDFVKKLYALYCAREGQKPDPEILHIIENWKAPKFPVDGDALIKAGQTPGPELGKKLQELEDQWIENGFSLS